jgi:hypothetical protein
MDFIPEKLSVPIDVPTIFLSGSTVKALFFSNDRAIRKCGQLPDPVFLPDDNYGIIETPGSRQTTDERSAPSATLHAIDPAADPPGVINCLRVQQFRDGGLLSCCSVHEHRVCEPGPAPDCVDIKDRGL